MNRKKYLVFVTAFAIIVCMFVGCSSGGTLSNSNSDLVGVWKLDDDFSPSGIRIPDTLEFFSDGTVQSDWGGHYTVDGERINIAYSAMDSYSYIFMLNGDELVLKSSGEYLSDATEYIYIRYDEQSETDNSLAVTCDEILAEGTNDRGDTYQLVLNYADNVNESETVGVIKNNQWLIDMSENPISEVPIDKFLGRFVQEFVLSNSFQIGEYIWNVETNKVYSLGDGLSALLRYTDYSKDPYNPVSATIINENKFVVCVRQNDENIYYLVNEETMQVEKKLSTDFEFGPYSEGLMYGENSGGEHGFYDESGNQIINLEKYYVGNDPVFINGQSIIYTYSDSGAVQHITIDKSGNILSMK